MPVSTGENQEVFDLELEPIQVTDMYSSVSRQKSEFPDLSKVLNPIELCNRVNQDYYCFNTTIAAHFPDKFISLINTAKTTIESDFDLPENNKTIEQKWYFAVAMAIYIKELRFVYPQFSDLFDGFTEKFISPVVYAKYKELDPLADYNYEFYRLWHSFYEAPVITSMVSPPLPSSETPKEPKGIAVKVANLALAAMIAAGAGQMYLDAQDSQVEYSPEVAPKSPSEPSQQNLVTLTTSTLPPQAEAEEVPVIPIELPRESIASGTEAESKISNAYEADILAEQLSSVRVPEENFDFSTVGQIPGQNLMFTTEVFTQNGINYTYYEPRTDIDFNGLNVRVSTLNDPLVQRHMAGDVMPELSRDGALAQNAELVLTRNFTFVEYSEGDNITFIPYIETSQSTYVALTYLTYEPQVTAEVDDLDTEDSLETKYAYLLNEEVEYTSKAGNTKSYLCTAIDGESVTLSAKNNPGFKFQVNLATLESREGCIKLSDHHEEVCEANEVDVVTADTGNRCDEVLTA
jgi:hypothetical protein